MKNLLWVLFAFATLAHAQGTVTDIDGNTYDYLTYGTQQWTDPQPSFDGIIDDIGIWNRALNSDEIESIYYSTTSDCDYQGNFLDQDGNQNYYINYGDLDWSVSEVNVTTYRDGTPIPLVNDESEWGSQSIGAYCYVNNDPNNNILYNYYAIIGKHDNDPNTPNKNLAPEGWRMPSDADWNNLTEFISNSDYVTDGNVAMAMASTSGWTNSSNQGAPGFMQSENNSSCFNAYPNGTRGAGVGFNQQGETSEFWSTDELTHYINFAINTFINTNNNAGNGKSARFVRDFEDNCTSDGTFIDQENHIYDYINYGTQSWSVLNAATEIYRDGTPIPQVTNLSDWSNLTTGAWTYFENDPAKGKLYNWYAVAGIHDNDPTTPNKEFAPDGWRVPNIDDWDILQNYLIESGFNYDGSLTGNKIGKSMASKSGWIISENSGDTGNQQNLNNSSCFNAIPYGMVNSYNFVNEGSSAIFWTSENLNSSSSYYRDINSNASSLGAGSDFNPPNGLTIASNWGCSVRLVKDLGCTTSIPTGDAEQTFCDAATVADLAATGENIQWYDAATGGNLLDSTTALTDGQTVYASQTVNGCESTDRLEVTVSIQDITITASATEVCTGESSTLNVALTNASGTFAEGQLVNEFNHTINTNASQQFPTTVGLNYRLEIEGNVTWGTYCPALAYDPAYVLSGFYGTTEATPRDFACNDAMYSSIFCDSPGLRPIPDQYDGINHSYDYYFTANSNQISVGFFDNLLGDNCGSVTFRLFENSTPPSQNSLVWSTGDTTETISVTPTETTEYWVDVTTNGVTCREYVTITVNDLPEAPTGEIVNYFINCDSFSPTLDDAIATLTGENIKLYDAAVGGNLLDPNSNIIDGQVVYASQTLDSCESSDRLEVQLNLYTLEMPVTAAPNNTVSFCNEQNLTILNLAPAQTATDRLWYETATSTTPIAETTPLVNGVNYYVSNYDIETGCESDRLAMTVEINNPEAPTGDAVQLFCDNVNVSDLSATGSNIQWYDAAIGGNVLDPSSALSDGQLLYASQTENSCESITRLEVSVEIDIIPDPILITTELEFCLAREATLADLEVDEQGFALEWYDSFSGGNMLPMDTLLEDGVSYYATLYDVASGCESLMRLEVVPTVIPCEVVIYNAISLNDNGMNDYMVIENAEYFPDNSLEVYNRDGHLLYSQIQYGIGDNLFRGIANVSGIYGSTLSGDGPRLPTGSYIYVFKYFNPYEQQEYTLKGFLTINSN